MQLGQGSYIDKDDHEDDCGADAADNGDVDSDRGDCYVCKEGGHVDDVFSPCPLFKRAMTKK